MADYTIRSVTIAEVLGDDGERYLTMVTEGEPATWDVLGMLDYARQLQRRQIPSEQYEGEDE